MYMQIAESKITPIWLIKIATKFAVTAMVCCFSAGSVIAQKPDIATQAPPALSPVDERSNDTTQLILRTVRDSNPQTAAELGEAVAIMMDIQKYNDARFYLAKIEALGLDDRQNFELQQAMGSDFFSSVQTSPWLQPEGKRLARKVLAAATKVSASPARIASLINVLNSSDILVRSAAFRELRLLGAPAAAELLSVFAHDDRVPDFPGVRSALKGMGPDAQGPLLGAASASDLQVQVEAIRALAKFETSESLDVMMHAYLSPKAPQFLRRIALDSLTRGNYQADPVFIEQRLYDRSMQYLLGKRQVSGALMGEVTIWKWDQATKKMIPEKVAPETASRIIASRRAADLYEISPQLTRNREMYLLTQLEAAKRVLGPSRRIDVTTIVPQLETDVWEIEKTLKQALKLDLVPAAIACCEVLEHIGSDSLLSGSAKPRPLVQAILHGERYLQFAAMSAIAKIDPKKAYPGSSYMLNLAVYLSLSENIPAGLVGHNREDIAQSYAAQLSKQGINARAATSSREFFRAATENPDIDVLLVTDTLLDPQYVELIQQLRSDWRTRRVPIALLYRESARGHRALNRLGDDPRFTAIPFSMSPDLVSTHVTRLHDMVRPWSVSNIDRRRHAAVAVKWLAKVSGDSASYPFYNLGSQQSELARLLYVPGFSESASQILASLGTPAAQRELVNFASQSNLPAEERQKVVDAFVKSVNQGGTLLTTSEIQQQYDRYNASRNDPESGREVLSTILDVIESRKRKAIQERKSTQ